jgi:hypothetical protein
MCVAKGKREKMHFWGRNYLFYGFATSKPESLLACKISDHTHVSLRK